MNYVSKLINQNFQFLIIFSDVVKHALELLDELYCIGQLFFLLLITARYGPCYAKSGRCLMRIDGQFDGQILTIIAPLRAP